MVIAFYLRELPFGGVEKMTLNLALELKSRGHTVIIVVNEKAGGYLNEFEAEFEVVSLGVPANIFKWNFLYFIIRATLGLIKLIKTRKVSLVVSAKEQANVISVFAKCIYSGFRLVLYRHVPLTGKGSSDSGRHTLLFYRYLYHLADKVVGVSEEICSQIRAISPALSAGKVFFIPNPVFCSAISGSERLQCYDAAGLPKDGRRKMLFVGRLSYQKGVDFLIDAMPSVWDAVGDIDLYIVGSGELEEQLKIKSEAYCSGIHFMGQSNRVYQLMSECDVFVMPSRYEGMPTVMIEAIAYAKAVVASDCDTGPREINRLTGRGHLFGVGNISEFLVAIKAALRESPCGGDKSQVFHYFSSKNSVDHLLRSFEV